MEPASGNAAAADQPSAVKLRWLRFHASLVRTWRRAVPMLVWYGQEVDVRVSLTGAGPDYEAGTEGAGSSAIMRAQQALHEAGVGFDSGGGFGARDWEWDHSLAGPISVAIVGKAARPERRRERPKPRLVINNAA